MTGIRRRSTAALLAVVLATFGTAATATAGSPAGAAGPTITATPATDLHQDDAVWLEVTGVAPARPAVVEWCPVTGGRCRLATSYAPDPDGTFSTEIVAEFHAFAPDGSDSDCRVEGCRLRMRQRQADGSTITASTPVAFAADQAPVGPRRVDAHPATGLRDRDIVTVSGLGADPEYPVQSVRQCALAIGVCTWDEVTDVEVAPDGAFTTPLTVRRYITRRDGPAVDCATEPCSVLTDQFGNVELELDAALTFDPAAPAPAPPVALAVPDSGLATETPARAQGIGFAAGETVQVSECDVAYPGGDCTGLGDAVADAAGAVDLDVTLVRLWLNIYGHVVDCGEPGRTCRLVLFGAESHQFANASLTFDGTAPIAEVTADPAVDLPYRGYLTVTGHHLEPGTEYHAEQCYPGAYCGERTTGTADADGNLSLRVLIRRIGFGIVNETGIPRIECFADCPVRFGRTSGPSVDSRTLQITFDPDAPPPPRPTISATPSTNLPATGTVRVTGSGFLEDSKVAVTECPTAARFSPCTPPTTVVADGHGAIAVDLPVQRMMGTVTPVDCAAAPGTCELRAYPPSPGFGVDDAELARTPLTFAGGVVPPPPPLGVSPTTGLGSGATVHVTRGGYPAGGLVALLMCRTGATEVTTGCDLTDFRFAFADAGGNLNADYVVRSSISVASVPVDCTAAARSCGVAAISAGLGSPLQVVPVTFGPTDPGHHHHHHGHHHHRHHHHRHHGHHHRDRGD